MSHEKAILALHAVRSWSSTTLPIRATPRRCATPRMPRRYSTSGFKILGAKGPGDIDSAFTAMSREHAGGAIVLVDAVLQNNRARITEFAARHRLPAVYGLSEYTDVGGLMAYGPDRLDMFRHAAIYIDQILKGAKPGDLLVEQPNKFSLVVNLKTAKALGLTIP